MNREHGTVPGLFALDDSELIPVLICGDGWRASSTEPRARLAG